MENHTNLIHLPKIDKLNSSSTFKCSKIQPQTASESLVNANSVDDLLRKPELLMSVT